MEANPRAARDVWVASIREAAEAGSLLPATQNLRGTVAGALSYLWSELDKEVRTGNRHALLAEAFGSPSTKNLTEGQCRALLAWAQYWSEDEGYQSSPGARIMADLVLAARQLDAGQGTLPGC